MKYHINEILCNNYVTKYFKTFYSFLPYEIVTSVSSADYKETLKSCYIFPCCLTFV